jgi:AbrB family looped-hinge helix DNA binding protein
MEIEITKITSKGQIVIPQEIREKAKIAEGERFFVYQKDDSIILKRTKKLEASEGIEEFERVFKSAWKTAKERGITRKDVKEAITETRRKKRNLKNSP